MNLSENKGRRVLDVARIIIIGFLITDVVIIFNKESIVSKSLAALSFLIFAVMLIFSFKGNKKEK